MGNGEKKEKEKASCRGVTSEDGACVRVLCVFQGPDFCVCVCVFKCVEMSSAFLLRVCFFSRCVAYRDPQLRCALVTVFSPPDVSFANRSNNMWTRIREYLS